ncbi:Sporulation kinase E [Enhygromyxa salina]|uniref:histidine kinase n=1 Tax=Enhygromyxa salina TaxID=215803 RepID=A0A2S9YFE9_9BACT|nr:AAA family ATPase [Enhygromyxa salina]PRQ03762.1 Sporulation kinase E [Enhygromyxa salina]
MTVSIAGYTTRKLLRASARAQVYEAQRKRDGKRVIAKVFELGDDGVEARVEHEFRLLEQLDVEGVVRALGVERVGDQLVLLLDYIVGENLEQHARGEPITVDAFLAIARSLAATLARVHGRRVVHRDIKPSNVLVEAGTHEVYLADFGISVLLESERQHLYDPEVLAGTLPYVSPEQTGRTTREVDFRSDLYSLGVTFYELLTGRRPFEASEPMELIHAHLARRPMPPHELVSTVPRQLSAIVMKLLEKAPEHRYQSASGLRVDLERLAEGLAEGEPGPSFELGEQDHPSTLQLPHQLYGRVLERAALEREFELVSKVGKRRLVLLGGAPGLGKTALLRTIAAPVSASGGYMAIGKFEQLQRELPYRGFVNAFTSLVEQVLTQSDERLGAWRRRLKRALGPIAGVVAAMVPELALVMGELPPVPSLGLGESRYRLHAALARFVTAFSQDGPLVLILDDLQWADPASIELLHVLLAEGGESAVLFVGAYRSDALDALDPKHPLRAFLAGLDEGHSVVTKLELQPLSRGDLERLLVDVLGREREAVAELAELVARKTGSNPLFVRQFLVHLETLGLLESSVEGWQWDAQEIAATQIPDDVLGVMQAKLDRLDPSTRELLALAACVGVRFDALTLAAVGRRGREQVAAALHELEVQGLISPDGSRYVFSHDRIQEAALERIDPETQRALRWEIGDRLLARHGEDELGEHLFEIVDQLDAGLPVDAMPERRRLLLARLNHKAGQRALDTGAWDSARRYLDLSVELLAKELAEARAGRRSELAFGAAFGRAQAMALEGQTAEADAAFEGLLGWQLSMTERAQVVARRARILALQERNADALDYALAGLAELGYAIPRTPSTAQMVLALMLGLRALKGVSREQLLELPAATDERVIAISHLLDAAREPAFVTSQELWVLILGRHTQLILRSGYHPTAPVSLSQLAMVLMAMGRHVAAGELAEQASELALRRECPPGGVIGTRAQMLTMVGPQCRPFRVVAEPMEAAHAEAIEAGDRRTAGMLGAIGLVNHLEAGYHLREILDFDARLRSIDEHYGSPEFWAISELTRRLLHCLIGTEGATFLRVDELDEIDISPLTRYAVISSEAWGRMMLGEVDEPWAMLQPLLGDYERVLLGSVVVPRIAMVATVLAAKRWPEADAKERRALLSGMRKRYKTIRRWAKICPENYQPMADIVGGELASVRGKNEAALRHFEAARSAALDTRAHYVAGIASARLAAWAEREGLGSTMVGARRSARAAFERMGARAVVERLDREQGRLLTLAQPQPEPSNSTLSALMHASLSSDGSARALDLAAVLDTIAVISEDLELEQVITRVLGSAIENVGADRGLLLLERGGGLALVAEGSGGETLEFMADPVALADARDRLPTAVVLYVVRTGSPVVVDDITGDSRFSTDAYVVRSGVRSLLCMPIIKQLPTQSERIGALVLENRLAAGAFTPARLEVLGILLAQAASALDNARLYAALGRSEARWRSLVDGVPDIIALMDGHAQLEFVNHLAPYDADPNELVGRRAEQVMDPASRAAWREAFSECVRTGSPRELEVCVAPEGLPRCWYMTRVVAVGEGSDTKYLTISTDISERKLLEAQVRQQQRLESLGTLASGVAHEINNPVQGILNYAELISAHADDCETVLEFSAEITCESERVAAIVRNLLAFSRQEREQQREDARLEELVAATLSLILAVIRKDDVRVIVDVPPDLPAVSCRPQQIQQIVMNLVTNARDALNERYQGYHDDKIIEIRAASFERGGQAWVRLTVADRGAGIPKDVRARIFDPFFTTKGRDQGTGLGLAVSHGIALEHGGELGVETEPGVGTRFHLDLPVDHPSVREVAQ